MLSANLGVHMGSSSRSLGPERLMRESLDYSMKNGGGTPMSLEGPG